MLSLAQFLDRGAEDGGEPGTGGTTAATLGIIIHCMNNYSFAPPCQPKTGIEGRFRPPGSASQTGRITRISLCGSNALLRAGDEE